jgi:hypothetical protein
MKKVFVLATAALLISGVSFANGGDKKKSGKECGSGKECCKDMKDCKKDMKSFGREHGLKGLVKMTDDIQKVCVSSQNSVDLEAYEKGFYIGWSEYCSPFNGFQLGLKADPYKSFCPQDKEELFHEKYLVGKKLFDKKDQLQDLQELLQSLNKESPTDTAGISQINSLKQEIQKIEQEIQLLDHVGRSPQHSDYY